MAVGMGLAGGGVATGLIVFVSAYSAWIATGVAVSRRRRRLPGDGR